MRTFVFALIFLLAAAHYPAPKQEPAPEFIIDDLLEALRGIFESWEISKEEVDKLLLCVGGMKDIEHQIAKIMEEIRQIDIKNIVKLVEAMVRLFGAVQQVFKDIEPCVDSAGEVKKLLDKFIHLTPMQMLTKLMLNLMDNGRKIYNDIIDLIASFREAKYYKFGYDIGDIIEALFFKQPDA